VPVVLNRVTFLEMKQMNQSINKDHQHAHDDVRIRSGRGSTRSLQNAPGDTHTLMAPARYASVLPVMSFVNDEVTMITSSAMVDMALIVRYIIFRMFVSWC